MQNERLFLKNEIKFFTFLSYAREFADPYLGHGIGPVPGYGVNSLYKNHFTITSLMHSNSYFFSCIFPFTGYYVSWRI